MYHTTHPFELLSVYAQSPAATISMGHSRTSSSPPEEALHRLAATARPPVLCPGPATIDLPCVYGLVHSERL